MTCAGRKPLCAQFGDEAAPVRDGEQHRVEGQQETDHRADGREQGGGLRVGLGGLTEQKQLVIGGLDVDASGREPAQLAGHDLHLRAGTDLDEHVGDASRQAAQRLGGGHQGDHHGA